MALTLAYLSFAFPSLAAAAYGRRESSWKWMLAAAAVHLPVILYLNAAPRFEGVLAGMLLYLVAVIALLKQRPELAKFSTMGISLYVAWIVVKMLFV